MKVEELRIHNYVSRKGKLCQVCRISGIYYSFNQQDISMLFFHDREIRSHILTSLDPLTISGDRLVKLGFDDMEEGGAYYKNGLKCSMGVDHARVFYHNMYIKDVNSVHEIQNLYYILKGEELQITEPENTHDDF